VASPWPQSRYSRAYLDVCRVLRQQVEGVKTFRFWDGSSSADDLPTAAQCPWLRATPIKRPIEYLASLGVERSATETPLGVQVDIAVAGYSCLPLMDLWEHVERALIGTDDRGPFLADPLLPGQVYLREPAIPTGPESFGAGLVIASGVIDFILYGEG